MARHRRLPKLDICRIRPERFHRMSPDQLMKIWVRLGASAPSRTTANSLVKGIVSNLAAMKSSESTYKHDPVQRRHSMAIYRGIVRNLENKLRVEQGRACGIRAMESTARTADDWRRIRNAKKRGGR